jgi:hypothetical protein
MKRFLGISVLIIIVVAMVWVVRAEDTSDFYKLSLPAKWKGEWFASEYTGPLPVTLEITRADEKTAHVIYSWKASSGWNIHRVREARKGMQRFSLTMDGQHLCGQASQVIR